MAGRELDHHRAVADHDVFGDGTVVIKFAPGHTPGHQVLSLKLANTGRVVWHPAAAGTWSATAKLNSYDFLPKKRVSIRAKKSESP